MAFTWTKDLETGFAQIDNEHKQLIKAADDLVTACSQGRGRQEIAQAVEKLFKVKVTDVRVATVLGKKKRLGRIVGQKSHWKKAIVTLAEGNRIEVAEGV